MLLSIKIKYKFYYKFVIYCYLKKSNWVINKIILSVKVKIFKIIYSNKLVNIYGANKFDSKYLVDKYTSINLFDDFKY